MFSRFENLPCVILEALCCGLPVIATDVGGVSEVVTSQNGILINSEDEIACTAAMLQMIENYEQFDRPAIASAAANSFSYAGVSSEINKVYNSLAGATGS